MFDPLVRDVELARDDGHGFLAVFCEGSGFDRFDVWHHLRGPPPGDRFRRSLVVPGPLDLELTQPIHIFVPEQLVRDLL